MDPNNEKKEIQRYLSDKIIETDDKSITELPYDKGTQFFPGAIVKYNKITRKITFITDIDRAPLSLLVNKESFKGNFELSSPVLGEISNENVSKAIHSMVQNMPNIPNRFRVEMYNVDSLEDLIFKLGFAAQIKDISSFISTFDFEHKQFATNALIKISNEYFTVNVSFSPSRGIFNFIKDDVSLSTIKNNISQNDIPLIVSNYEYGGTIFISIRTSMDYSDLQAKLQINGAGIINIGSFIRNMRNNSNIQAVYQVIGFSAKISDALKCGNIDESVDLINEFENCFGNPQSYSLYHINDLSLFSYPNQIEMQKNEENIENKSISILYITSKDIFKRNIDFSFVNKYRKKYFSINVISVDETDFISCLDNSDYLNTFNVIMLGGIDCKNHYSKINLYAANKIEEWHTNTNGIILFLHDFITGERVDLFQNSLEKLGYIKKKPVITKFKKVYFVNNTKKKLFNSPYRIKSQSFSVIRTHESAVYNENNVVIKANDVEEHYYVENLKERIADLSIGHIPKLSSIEEKLFINIIYHLTNQTEEQSFGVQDDSGQSSEYSLMNFDNDSEKETFKMIDVSKNSTEKIE